MDKTQDRTAAAGDSVDPGRWQQELDMLFATKVAPLFARREPRAAARAMLAGLLSSLERKNGWWLAEHAGHVGPDAMQRLLRTARWDETQLIAGLRGYVVEQLGHAQAVLVADETGFAKKGTLSRPLHKLPYDEPAVMPRPVETPLGSAGVRCRARHNRWWRGLGQS